MKSFTEYLDELYEGIDWEKVKEAAVNAAEDIHGKPDMKIIDGMIDTAREGGEAKDTEDAIQIVINMMR